jgi:hypothetical protein
MISWYKAFLLLVAVLQPVKILKGFTGEESERGPYVL